MADFVTFVKAHGFLLKMSAGMCVMIPAGFIAIETSLENDIHGIKWTVHPQEVEKQAAILKHLTNLIQENADYNVPPGVTTQPTCRTWQRRKSRQAFPHKCVCVQG